MVKPSLLTSVSLLATEGDAYMACRRSKRNLHTLPLASCVMPQSVASSEDYKVDEQLDWGWDKRPPLIQKKRKQVFSLWNCRMFERGWKNKN